MKYYYLASFTWIIEILLFISLIGIPAVLYLRGTTFWWYFPYKVANEKALEKKREKIRKRAEV